MFACHSASSPARRSLRLPIGIVCLLLVGLSLPRPVSGQEAVGTAVPRVTNPSHPAEGTRDVTLKEAWRLGAGDGEIFGMVSSAFRDPGGNVCLIDNQTCELRIFSADGKPVRKMGRKGEGPGEVQYAGGACSLPDGGYAMVQAFPGKLILFQPDGTPAGTVVPQMAASEGQSFLVLVGARASGSNLAIACMNQIISQQTMKMRREHLLGVFDRKGALVSKLLSATDDLDLSQGIKMTERGTNRYQGRWTVAPDGTIYSAPDIYGYEIHAFDSQGREKTVFGREYQSVTRTAEEKKTIEELYAGFMRNAPNVTFTVEDVHPDIQDVAVGPDGNLWVLTSQGKYRAPAGVMGVYDVFTPEGRFLRQVSLHGTADPTEDEVTIAGDRVIVVRNFLSAVKAFAGSISKDAGGAKAETTATATAGEGDEATRTRTSRWWRRVSRRRSRPPPPTSPAWSSSATRSDRSRSRTRRRTRRRGVAARRRLTRRGAPRPPAASAASRACAPASGRSCGWRCRAGASPSPGSRRTCRTRS